MTDETLILSWRGLFGRRLVIGRDLPCDHPSDDQADRLQALQTAQELRQLREAEVCKLLQHAVRSF